VSQNLDPLLLSAGFTDDPYPIYKALRDSAPVYWSEAWDSWLVTSYAFVAAIAQDHTHFSNVGRRSSHFEVLPEPLRSEMRPLEEHFTVGMGNTDPPEHRRYGAMVEDAFTPRAVRSQRPLIQRIASGLVNEMGRATEFDLVASFAYPLPAAVIAEIIGFPAADRDRFKAWADDFVGFQGGILPNPTDARRNLRSFLEARHWLLDLAEERRQRPRDDLLSKFVSPDRAEPLTSEDILAICVVLMVGGHETTTSLLSSAALGLMEHPEQRALLREDQGHIRSAVEEFLRFESPIQQSLRVAREDVEVNGRLIRRGGLVRLMLGAANRDPEVFRDPDRLDVTRKENKHLAFLTGIHFCLGAWLARLEAEVAISAIVDTLDTVSLASFDLHWRSGTINRQLLALPVRRASGETALLV
jgi:cytochrome P450